MKQFSGTFRLKWQKGRKKFKFRGSFVRTVSDVVATSNDASWFSKDATPRQKAHFKNSKQESPLLTESIINHPDTHTHTCVSPRCIINIWSRLKRSNVKGKTIERRKRKRVNDTASWLCVCVHNTSSSVVCRVLTHITANTCDLLQIDKQSKRLINNVSPVSPDDTNENRHEVNTGDTRLYYCTETTTILYPAHSFVSSQLNCCCQLKSPELVHFSLNNSYSHVEKENIIA